MIDHTNQAVDAMNTKIIEPKMQGTLRARMVANLAGVPSSKLGRWHRGGLVSAHTLPGNHSGGLRLYSWIDYMKVRAARALLENGVSPRNLRDAIAYLEATTPDWYLAPLHEFRGRVVHEREASFRIADRIGQLAFGPIVTGVERTLEILQEEGPLGEMRSFGDVINMDPRIVGGNPIVRGTRLEAGFLWALAGRGMDIDEIADSYDLSTYQIERAIAFMEAAA